jgi:uncharacterized protein DUF3237
MNSRLLMTLQVVVVGPQKIGAVLHGTHVTAPIASGQFEGPRLHGKVLPGSDLLLPDHAALAVGVCEIRADGPVHLIEEIL